MTLTPDQLTSYWENGFLLVESVLTPAEVAALNEAFVQDAAVPGPHLILEDDGRTPRALYASHLRHTAFRWLVRCRRLLAPAGQLVSDRLYVHQLKINAKHAFGGESWAWHQDFVVWRDMDGMPAPRAVNVAVFLSDVTEFSGPVIFLPGTHRLGTLVDGPRRAAKSDQHVDPDDYALSRDLLVRLVDEHGMVSPKGPAGSVVLFHTEIVHGSATNMSPYARNLLIVTYNDVANAPRRTADPRPEYLTGRNLVPLVPSDAPLPTADLAGERR